MHTTCARVHVSMSSVTSPRSGLFDGCFFVRPIIALFHRFLFFELTLYHYFLSKRRFFVCSPHLCFFPALFFYFQTLEQLFSFMNYIQQIAANVSSSGFTFTFRVTNPKFKSKFQRRHVGRNLYKTIKIVLFRLKWCYE